MKRRKRTSDGVKTGEFTDFRDQSGRYPAYGLVGVRRIGGVTLIQALVWNMGTCRPDAKGATQVGGPHECLSTDAGHGGGAARSSDEGSVMGLERRGCIIQLCKDGQPAMGGSM